MFKKFTSYLLIVLVLHSGCASILNGQYQQVQVFTNSANSKVYVNDELAGKGKVVSTKLKRDLYVKQLAVESEGFKKEYDIAVQKKTSALYIMSWIPFACFIYPPFFDKGPKSKNYDKEFVIKPATKIVSKQDNERFIYLKNTSFNVDKGNLKIESYDHKEYTKSNGPYNIETGNENIDLPNTIFSDVLNGILKKNGYLDTTRRVLQQRTNTMFLNAKVDKVTFKKISPKFASNYYYQTELSVTWSIQDIYDQPKFEKTIVSKSGHFAGYHNLRNRSYDQNPLFKCVEDALTVSFYQFLAEKNVRDLVTIDPANKPSFTTLRILPPTKQKATLKVAQKATVTVAIKDTHGSGCLINNEGYLVTNYHVVAGAKDPIEIILSDGDKYKASVIRINEEADLALLKIDRGTAIQDYFEIARTPFFEAGDDVFAIGTPHSIELSQTLSKGIISGIRKLPDNSMLIQTDVSVSPGNSGGALVSKDGKLIGIVNSKLVGYGVDGIVFCIPADAIRKALAVE